MGLTKALYGTGANLQTAPQKTKYPASLVCHVVDVVIPLASDGICLFVDLWEAQPCLGDPE